MAATLAQVLKRHFIGTIVVGAALASAFVYLGTEYHALQKDKDELTARQHAFDDSRVKFEAHKSEIEKALLTQKNEIEKREFVLQQSEAKLKENTATVQEGNSRNSAVEAALRNAAVSLSDSQRRKEDEEQLRKVIGEFSKLGVDLNSAPPCDAEGRQRYEAAQAKYREAAALAMATGLDRKYNAFFSHSAVYVRSRCD